MKKQIRNLIIGLVIVAALVGVLLVVMNLPEQQEESSSTASASTTTIKLLELTLDDIETIEVKNTEEYTLVREPNTDNEWIIEDLEGLPKIKNSYAMLALSMCSLSAQKVIAEDVTDLGQYGLAEPVSVVTAVMKDGSRHTIEIGNEAPGGNNYTYVKLPGESTVYVVSTSDVSRMLQVRTDYISTDVFTLSDEGTPSVVNCTLGGTSRTSEIKIEVVDAQTSSGDAYTGYSNYLITSPSKRDTNTTVFDEVSSSVFYTTVSEIVAYHVTDEQIAEYGLDEPYSTLQMTYMDGEETYHLDYRASEMQGDGSFYLMIDDVPVIYRATIGETEYGNNWHNIQYATVASRLFILPYINDLAAVTVETPDGSYRFELTLVDAGTDDEKLNIHYEGKAITEDAFKKFYQVIIGPTSEQLVDPSEELDLTSPLLTFTYEYTDSSKQPDVVSFYKGPVRQVYVAVNGEVEFTTRDAFMDKVYCDIPKVINNEEVITDW